MTVAPTYTVAIFDSQVLKDADYDSTAGDYTDSLTTEQVYLAGGLARVFGDSTHAMPQVAGSKYADPSIHTFLNLQSQIGSGAFVVDQDTSELVERTAYMPYGSIDADWRPTRWQGSREDIKYTGHWDEAQVGLVYFGARYYSPQLGRFISPDPLAIHGLQAVNPYEYANSNPLRYVDPTGLDPSQSGGDYPVQPPDEGPEEPPQPAPLDSPSTSTTVTATGNSGDKSDPWTPRSDAAPYMGAGASFGPGAGRLPWEQGRGLARSPVVFADPVMWGQTCTSEQCGHVFFVPVPDGAAFAGAWAWVQSLLGLGVAVEAADAVTLRATAGRAFNQFLTKAGRELSKHPEVINETAATFRKVLTSDGAVSQRAAQLVEQILENGARAEFTHQRYGAIIEYLLPTGIGARWYAETHEFIGFITKQP